MSDETYVTVKGRLTADPELRYATSGSAVSNFTVAARSRRFDKQTNEWKDQPTTFHGQAYAANEQQPAAQQDQGWGGATNTGGGWGDPAASGQGGWGNPGGQTY